MLYAQSPITEPTSAKLMRRRCRFFKTSWNDEADSLSCSATADMPLPTFHPTRQRQPAPDNTARTLQSLIRLQLRRTPQAQTLHDQLVTAMHDPVRTSPRNAR